MSCQLGIVGAMLTVAHFKAHCPMDATGNLEGVGGYWAYYGL